MKTDLGGILVRVRHSEFTSKQVQKVVGVSYVCNLPAFLAKTLNRSQRSETPQVRNLLERSSHLLSPLENPAGLNTLEVSK